MIKFSDSRIPMGRDKRLKINTLVLDSGEFWVISGPGGSGKSSLARAVAGMPDSNGYCQIIPGLQRTYPHENGVCAWISFDQEREIKDLLRRNDDSEVLGRPDDGISLHTFIGGSSGTRHLNPELLEKLSGRGIRNLSSGEFRQAFIAREAGKKSALAVLDEPFEGLDSEACKRLKKQLNEWADSGTLIVITVNRLDDIPLSATGVIVLDGRGIEAVGKPSEIHESANIAELFRVKMNQKDALLIPAPPHSDSFHGGRLVEMNGVNLSFNGRRVLSDITWRVEQGESWLLTGPNGSGKTTLLNLISGDEPRGYGQNLKLFGRKKGSGETNWDIKKHIGHVSSIMQDSLSRNANPVEIIGSGLRDSLIPAVKLDGFETNLVDQWLRILGLQKYRHTAFFHLPCGAQRLAMTGRAMIKHPPLLLLDEPMHGLDIASRNQIKRLLGILIQETHTAVIFVSHRPADAPHSIMNCIRLVPSETDGISRAEISRRDLISP